MVGPKCWRCNACKLKRRKAYLVGYLPGYYQRNQRHLQTTAREWSSRRRHADFEKYREQRVRSNLKTYGLTPADYDAMLASQGGLCAICKTPPVVGARGRLYVDHDHSSGTVRGLLCKKCNIALGLLDDRPELMAAALEYLRRHDQ